MSFGGAPVSRALVLATAGSSVLAQAVRAARRPMPPHIAAFEQAFVFWHPGELLFGVGLLYYFRLLERQMGTAKFGGRLLATTGLSCLLRLAAGQLFRWHHASGPYGFLFSCFVPFALNVPPLHRFQLFGLRLTDKAFVWAAGLQMLLSTPRLSAPAGAAGLLAGVIYQLNPLGLRRFKLPRWACALFGAQVPAEPVVRHAGPAGAAGAAARLPEQQQQQPGGRHQAQQQQQLPPPSQEGIAQLAAMGFDVNRAAQALQQTGNDVNAAIALLV